MVGLIRVKEAAVDAFLRYNGVESVFVERVGLLSDGDRTHVEWVEMEDADEGKSDYLKKALDKAARIPGCVGLTCGRRQLGLRLKGQRSEPRARVWEIRDTPPWWCSEVLQDAVKSVMGGIKVIKRSRNSGGGVWLFRAAPKEDQERWRIPTTDDDKDIELWIKPAPPPKWETKRWFKPIQQRNAAWLGIQGINRDVRKEVVKGEREKDKDEGMEGGVKKDDVVMTTKEEEGKDGEGDAGKARAPPSKRRQVEVEVRKTPQGYEHIAVHKDGECI